MGWQENQAYAIWTWPYEQVNARLDTFFGIGTNSLYDV